MKVTEKQYVEIGEAAVDAFGETRSVFSAGRAAFLASAKIALQPTEPGEVNTALDREVEKIRYVVDRFLANRFASLEEAPRDEAVEAVRDIVCNDLLWVTGSFVRHPDIAAGFEKIVAAVRAADAKKAMRP